VIVAYVSGHGFGHATRTAAVLSKLRELQPELAITVVSAAPERLFRRAISGPLTIRRLECDVGLLQADALSIDEAATAARWKEFEREWPDHVDAEWRWLRHVGARVVVGDIPPLAFQVAHEVGVPSLALANFSWDWIYRHLGQRQPTLREAAARCAESYARAGLLLKLPFAGDLRAFRRAESIPLVARVPQLEREQARQRLGLGGETTLLLSFGGFGLARFDASVLGGVSGVVFLTTDPLASPPRNVRVLDMTRLEAMGVEYPDVVGAVDVVVTKPGYGIVSDAIGAGVRMIYTERGDFPEYDVLVKELPRWLPCVHVSQAELRAGRIGEAVRQVLAKSPPPALDISGAEVAAVRILETAARGSA
jgi:L-arabinokinase